MFWTFQTALLVAASKKLVSAIVLTFDETDANIYHDTRGRIDSSAPKHGKVPSSSRVLKWQECSARVHLREDFQ